MTDNSRGIRNTSWGAMGRGVGRDVDRGDNRLGVYNLYILVMV